MADVLFADAAATVRAILVAAAIGVPVVGKIPNPRPSSFVQLARSGGTSRDVVVDDAFMSVDSWAPAGPAAMALAQQARAALHAAAHSVVGGVAVYRVAELAGPADVPDPDSDSHRVRQTFQIGLRGHEQ